MTRRPIIGSLAAAFAIHLQAPAALAQPRHTLPVSFVEQALCVHSGWHYATATTRRQRRHADYWIDGRAYVRTWNVPDSVAGGSGEGGWTDVNASYGGGMQFTLGTWNRAAALSQERVPYASSNAGIAGEPAVVQILAAYLIVRQDGGSWREWPETSAACGLR